jgi:hypothetical protein
VFDLRNETHSHTQTNKSPICPVVGKRTLPGTVARASDDTGISVRTGRIASIYGEFQNGSDGTQTRDLRRDSAGRKRRNALEMAISIHV